MKRDEAAREFRRVLELRATDGGTSFYLGLIAMRQGRWTDAIECFLLIAFLAYNIFHAFFALNLKPQIRKGRTQAFWARLMAAEILAEVNPASSSP